MFSTFFFCRLHACMIIFFCDVVGTLCPKYIHCLCPGRYLVMYLLCEYYYLPVYLIMYASALKKYFFCSRKNSWMLSVLRPYKYTCSQNSSGRYVAGWWSLGNTRACVMSSSYRSSVPHSYALDVTPPPRHQHGVGGGDNSSVVRRITCGRGACNDFRQNRLFSRLPPPSTRNAIK